MAAKKGEEVKAEKPKSNTMPVVNASDASNRSETVKGIHEGKKPKFGQSSF